MKRDRFVVGFKLSGNCVYGQDHFGDDPLQGYADPMTIAQARKAAKGFDDPDTRIYELVEVPPKKKKRKK